MNVEKMSNEELAELLHQYANFLGVMRSMEMTTKADNLHMAARRLIELQARVRELEEGMTSAIYQMENTDYGDAFITLHEYINSKEFDRE
jgi:hypothetical protein